MSMLDPNDRRTYLDQLRPPDGYLLDRAIATTYSLDLLSLLMAPLSMVCYETGDFQQVLRDPIALVEALRMTIGRFAVFCQQGKILLPRTDTRLYSYLEKAVVPVVPPAENGSFHPKMWLLRFASEDPDHPTLYRLLCLSRNLTLDRSWDTVLALEGPVRERREFKRNRALAAFVSALPGMACAEVPGHVSEHIALIEDELARVRFDPPPGFEEGQDAIEFLPMGIDGYSTPPHLEGGSRLLVMSPFLSDSVLKPLSEYSKDNVLISRLDSLDRLQATTLAALQCAGCRVYALDDGAHSPDEDESLAPEPDPGMENASGLHAKLFVVENGGQAWIYTGSANATAAAFHGANVEFMVALAGPRRKVGIDSILGAPTEDDKDRASLAGLLQPYQRCEPPEPADAVQVQVEEDLRRAQSLLARGGLNARVSLGEEGYGIELASDSLFRCRVRSGAVVVRFR